MKENNGKGTARAAITGAIVGAGAVIAGVVALSERKNQEKIRKAPDFCFLVRGFEFA